MFEIRKYHFYNENGCQPFAMQHSLLPNVLLFLAFHALPKIQYTVFKHSMRGKRESKDIQSTTTNSRTLWHCRERTLFPQHGLLKKRCYVTHNFLLYATQSRRNNRDLTSFVYTEYLSSKYKLVLLIFHINMDCMLNNYRHLSMSIKMFA